MSEAIAFNSPLPEGWYQDPAKSEMQRWWTGAAWTEHVRYSMTPRLTVVAPAPLAIAPQPSADFDDFYVPMRNFEPNAARMAPQRQSASFAGLWLVAIAVIGIAVGVALFVLLPR